MTRNIASGGLEILFRSLGPRKTSLSAHVFQATAARRPTPSFNFSHPPITCSSRFPYSKGTETRNTFSFFFSLLSNFSFLASFLRIIICIYTLILFVLFSSHPDKQGFFFHCYIFFSRKQLFIQVHPSSLTYLHCNILFIPFPLLHWKIFYHLARIPLPTAITHTPFSLSFISYICRITTTTRVISFFFLRVIHPKFFFSVFLKTQISHYS